TSGGIYGTIGGFRESTVQLQIASQVEVDLARSAITGVVTGETEDANKQEKGKKEKGLLRSFTKWKPRFEAGQYSFSLWLSLAYWGSLVFPRTCRNSGIMSTAAFAWGWT